MSLLKSKLFIAAAIVAVLVGLYALLGFKVAPNMVRNKAIEFVHDTYGRELKVGEVRLQPFKLQIEVKDVAFPDADGQTMLGFERLFADFEVSSLWKRAWYFRDIEVEAPFVRAVVRPPGAMNLADLAIKKPPGAPPAEPELPPSVWIASFDVSRGAVDFVDQARSKPFERRFDPVAFTLKEFRTTPEGGDFHLTAQSENVEQFDWKGRFALAPLVSSSGDFTIADLRAAGVGDILGDALPFALSKGTIDLNGRYTFKLAEATQLDVELPSIEIHDLGLRARNADADWVDIPTLVVKDTHAKMPERTVAIAHVELANLKAQLWKDSDGSINLKRLFAPAPADAPATTTTPATTATPSRSTATAQGTTTAATSQAGAKSAWDVQLQQVAVNAATINFEDRTITPAFKLVMAPTNVTVDKVSLDLTRPLPIKLTTAFDGGGSLTAAGDLVPDPLQAALDIDLRDLRLKRLQPYVAKTTDMTIRAGQANAKGRLELNPPGGKDGELVFAGDVNANGFKTIDNALEEDFFNFDRLEMRKLRYSMTPDSLAIDRVLLLKPFAKIINSSNQVLNVAAVLDPQGTAEMLRAREAEAAAQKAEATTKPPKKERESKKAAKTPAPAAPNPELHETGMPIRIREVRLDSGRMDFADYYIQPNFAAQIESLHGTMTGLSSNPNAHAKVDLKGQVGEFSPVTIAGEIQPFAFDRYTDIGLKFENISLPVFNPYSGRFAGFNIAKGKLTTDLHYTIVDRKLDAKHHIRIDQLEWGEATASKQAVPLPIKFATSLLKDVNGVIDLDVPVTGTLDDPSFRVGPIVWKVIKNLLTKIVTAPFRWLGGLFKGAEDAQFVDFAPGVATLEPAATEKLATLAKGLAQKPELKLDIPIGTVTSLDEPALKNQRYASEQSAAIKRVLKKKAVVDGEPVTFDSLEADQQIAVLKDMVANLTGAQPKLPELPERAEGESRKDAKAQAQQATIEYLTGDASSHLTVAEADVEALSTARASAVQSALLTPGELSPDRVFLERSDKVTAHEGKVRLELELK